MPFIDVLLGFVNTTFVETGTFNGDTIAKVANNAISIPSNIISLELSDVYFNACKKRFKNNPNIHLHKGNSKYDLYDIIKDIPTNITFWLDSHWSGAPDTGCDPETICPLLEELEQIKRHKLNTHTIMINDIRLMNNSNDKFNGFPIDTDQIITLLYEINPNYTIKCFDDYTAQNDILVAYVEDTNEIVNSVDDNDITVVYKTFKNDLQWIYYSLLSLKKFVRGIHEIIIYCHDNCCNELYQLIRNINLNYRIIPVTYDYHGYLKQQIVKATCFKDVKTKYVVIVDSDNIFNISFNIKNLIQPSGKIKWYYCDDLSKDPNANTWRTAYESMTKTTQNVHYMSNRHPFVFTTKSLKEASTKFHEIHGVDYNTFCKNGCMRYHIRTHEPVAGSNGRFTDLSKIFTEFEWLGYYCHNFSEDYIFVSTDTDEFRNRTSRLIQFWSHGGIAADIKTQIEQLLE
jgi:hypothetical protein